MTTYVPVSVPEQHLDAVYELLMRLRSERAEWPVQTQAPVLAEVTADTVERIYGELAQGHRDLLRYLRARPGEWLGSREIANALHLKNGSRSLAGLLGSFGRRLNKRYPG